MIILDTHVLVWATGDERKLGRRARTLINQYWAIGKVAVSAIAFWEVGLLQARRRLQLPLPVREWRDTVLAAGATELPLDGVIAVRALDLASLHDDPADRFTVASALVHDATLITADERLLEWHHALERHDARK